MPNPVSSSSVHELGNSFQTHGVPKDSEKVRTAMHQAKEIATKPGATFGQRHFSATTKAVKAVAISFFMTFYYLGRGVCLFVKAIFHCEFKKAFSELGSDWGSSVKSFFLGTVVGVVYVGVGFFFPKQVYSAFDPMETGAIKNALNEDLEKLTKKNQQDQLELDAAKRRVRRLEETLDDANARAIASGERAAVAEQTLGRATRRVEALQDALHTAQAGTSQTQGQQHRRLPSSTRRSTNPGSVSTLSSTNTIHADPLASSSTPPTSSGVSSASSSTNFSASSPSSSSSRTDAASGNEGKDEKSEATPKKLALRSPSTPGSAGALDPVEVGDEVDGEVYKFPGIVTAKVKEGGGGVGAMNNDPLFKAKQLKFVIETRNAQKAALTPLLEDVVELQRQINDRLTEEDSYQDDAIAREVAEELGDANAPQENGEIPPPPPMDGIPAAPAMDAPSSSSSSSSSGVGNSSSSSRQKKLDRREAGDQLTNASILPGLITQRDDKHQELLDILFGENGAVNDKWKYLTLGDLRKYIVSFQSQAEKEGAELKKRLEELALKRRANEQPKASSAAGTEAPKRSEGNTGTYEGIIALYATHQERLEALRKKTEADEVFCIQRVLEAEQQIVIRSLKKLQILRVLLSKCAKSGADARRKKLTEMLDKSREELSAAQQEILACGRHLKDGIHPKTKDRTFLERRIAMQEIRETLADLRGVMRTLAITKLAKDPARCNKALAFLEVETPSEPGHKERDHLLKLKIEITKKQIGNSAANPSSGSASSSSLTESNKRLPTGDASYGSPQSAASTTSILSLANAREPRRYQPPVLNGTPAKSSSSSSSSGTGTGAAGPASTLTATEVAGKYAAAASS